MMKILSTFILIIVSGTSLHAAEPLTMGTAITLEEGHSEIGVFTPYRHGLSDDMEISTHYWANLLFPNVALKKRWISNGAWTIASEHAFSYPTLMMDAVSKDGILGLLPSSVSIPQMLTINNTAYFSYRPSEDLIVTPHIGVELTLGGNIDTLYTIDYPLLYQETASYYTGQAWNIGVDVDGSLSQNWAYSADLEYDYLPGLTGDYSLSSKLMFTYRWRKNKRTLFGIKAIKGSYPFGMDNRNFILMDVIWNWQ